MTLSARWLALKKKERYCLKESQRKKKDQHLSLTLEHGSIDSSFTAMRALHPSTTLFKYTNGVFPINYNSFIKLVHTSLKIKNWSSWERGEKKKKLTSVTSLAIPILDFAIIIFLQKQIILSSVVRV
jgi:hypothetical protein